MPDKKPDPSSESMNPATAAHVGPDPKPDAPESRYETPHIQHKPEAPAKAEKSLVDPKDASAEADPKPSKAPAPAPAAPRRTIDELLKDQLFDPDGLVRIKLAALVRDGKGSEPAPSDLVDDAGKPIRQMA